MRLNPLSEGAAAARAWPTFDPEPAALLLVDFIGSKMAGRPIYKRLNDRFGDANQIPGLNYSGSTSNGQPRYAETKSGKLVPFAANVLRVTDKGLLVEEARTNIIVRSNVADGVGWANSGATTSAGDVWGPFTGVTIASAGQNWHRRESTPSIQLIAGTVYAYRAYVRSGTSGRVRLVFRNGSVSTETVLVGVFGAGISVISTASGSATVSRRDMSDGVVEITGTFTPNASAGYAFGIGADAVTAGQTVEGFFFELQPGAFITSPIITNGAAATRATDIPYIINLAAILGQFRTNFVPYSADTSNVAWGNVAVSKTTGQADPFGGSGAALVQANGTSAVHYHQAPTTSFTSGAFYTTSRYVKAGTQSLIQLTGNNSVFTSSGYANFDLASGTVTQQAGLSAPASITPVGGGWYRIAITALASNTQGQHGGALIFITTPTSPRAEVNTLATTIYDTGAQVEVGGLTEFIVTGGAAASAGNPFTLVAWGDVPGIDGARRLISAFPATGSTPFAYMNRWTDGNAYTAAYDMVAGVQVARSFGGKGGARVLKAAVRVRGNLISGVVDGAAVSSSALGGAPGSLDRIILGANQNGGEQLNGYIQRIAIYGDVDDATLQALAA